MSATLRGVALYLGALLLFTGMDAVTKAAVAEVPVLQVLWARFTFHLVAVSAVTLLTTGRIPWRSGAPGLQAVRSLTLVGANLSFTAALVTVPLMEATAINFVSPLIVVVIAAVWLKEAVGWRRYVGVVIGFLGVLVVLRPGMGAVPPAGFLALITALLFAFYQIMTRRLAGVDTPQTTILHTGIAGAAVTALLQPFIWAPLRPEMWGLLVAIGAMGGAGHYLLVLAFERAPASLLAPFAYTQMLWATLFGMVVFGELPDAATIAGGVVIAAGGLTVIWSEAAAKRPPPG